METQSSNKHSRGGCATHGPRLPLKNCLSLPGPAARRALFCTLPLLLHAGGCLHAEAVLVSGFADVDSDGELSFVRVSVAAMHLELVRAAGKHASHHAFGRRAVAPMDGGLEKGPIDGFKVGK